MCLVDLKMGVLFSGTPDTANRNLLQSNYSLNQVKKHLSPTFRESLYVGFIIKSKCERIKAKAKGYI